MITEACCSSSSSPLSSTSSSLSKSDYSVVLDSGLGLGLSLSGSGETNLDQFWSTLLGGPNPVFI